MDEWVKYCDSVLPGKATATRGLSTLTPHSLSETARAPKQEDSAPAVNIIRNANGIPLFPSVDLDTLSPHTLMEVMRQYFKALWGE
jgi:hypothetical protein